MRIEAILKAGQRVASRGGQLAARIKTFFTGNPAALTAFAAKVPGLAGKRITLNSVTQYVKENPLSAITILYTVGEASSLVTELFDADPDLEQLVMAFGSTDTVDTVTQDRSEVVAAREKAMSDNLAKVDALPVSSLIEFKDEAAMIDRVVSRMPGRTYESQMVQLTELRRVLSMPDSNFLLHEKLRNLQV